MGNITRTIQALWLLDRALERHAFEDVNKRLTYFIGADKTGWDAGQLLRIPGSVSTKHGSPHRVALLPGRGPVYRAHDLSALLHHVQVAPTTTAAIGAPPDACRTAREVLARHGRKLPPTALITIRASSATGHQQRHLWHLYRKLFALGLTAEEVFALVKPTVWNKWPHQPQRLWVDVNRSQERIASARCLGPVAESRPADPLVARASEAKSRAS